VEIGSFGGEQLLTPDRSGRIRVVIVDDHQLVSDSLGMLLDGQPDIEVIGYASSLNDVTSLAPSVAPDVVIMDCHLGDGTGQEAAAVIRASHPNARFVFLSRDDGDDALLGAVQAGASAFIHKSKAASEVIDAVRKVASGTSLIAPASIAALMSRHRDRDSKRESLTHREREVLQLMAEGTPSRRIADELGISYATVRSHIRSIGSKLGARSKLNAVAVARDLELVN
jgi:DNA-binding NarL/FixJ family response regulator